MKNVRLTSELVQYGVYSVSLITRSTLFNFGPLQSTGFVCLQQPQRDNCSFSKLRNPEWDYVFGTFVEFWGTYKEIVHHGLYVRVWQTRNGVSCSDVPSAARARTFRERSFGPRKKIQLVRSVNLCILCEIATLLFVARWHRRSKKTHAYRCQKMQNFEIWTTKVAQLFLWAIDNIFPGIQTLEENLKIFHCPLICLSLI